MTPLICYDYLAQVLGCLDAWDAVIDELRAQGAQSVIDVTAIARRVCSLDAVTRSTMRSLEELMMGERPRRGAR